MDRFAQRKAFQVPFLRAKERKDKRLAKQYLAAVRNIDRMREQERVR